MSFDQDTASKWDGWNQSGGPRYPHEKIVQFCFRHYPKGSRSGVRVLDLGCGSGVHLLFLAREGFVATGVDISSVGINNARQWLEKEGLSAQLHTGSVDTLDFPTGSFDLIISVGVLDAAGAAVADGAVRQAGRLLRPGGRGCFVFASDADFRIADDNVLGLHGYARLEVEALFRGRFSSVWFDLYVTTYQNGAIQQNDWLVTVER
ncbi:MAG: methyltransferase domain-containing protein [Acidobacteria bacterium]|nr:methyltransferase domain-containing protein [Acidobacteriota bacterium]